MFNFLLCKDVHRVGPWTDEQHRYVYANRMEAFCGNINIWPYIHDRCSLSTVSIRSRVLWKKRAKILQAATPTTIYSD